MMNELTPPVIVDEHGDIQLYANVEAAAADVEAIDVRNGEYEFFDSAGRVIEPTIDDATSTVRLTGHEYRLPVPNLLADRLRRFVEQVGIERIGISKLPSEMSLEELVDALSGFFGLPGIRTRD